MIGRYLLDTNVAIAILEKEIDLERHRGSEIESFLNATVAGELLFGAEKSRRIDDNIARIFAVTQRCPVLPCDLETARHYGVIKQRLSKRGRPIPENDIWIAASARQHGLILATRDGHFEDVEDLRFERW